MSADITINCNSGERNHRGASRPDEVPSRRPERCVAFGARGKQQHTLGRQNMFAASLGSRPQKQGQAGRVSGTYRYFMVTLLSAVVLVVLDIAVPRAKLFFFFFSCECNANHTSGFGFAIGKRPLWLAAISHHCPISFARARPLVQAQELCRHRQVTSAQGSVSAVREQQHFKACSLAVFAVRPVPSNLVRQLVIRSTIHTSHQSAVPYRTWLAVHFRSRFVASVIRQSERASALTIAS